MRYINRLFTYLVLTYLLLVIFVLLVPDKWLVRKTGFCTVRYDTTVCI